MDPNAMPSLSQMAPGSAHVPPWTLTPENPEDATCPETPFPVVPCPFLGQLKPLPLTS